MRLLDCACSSDSEYHTVEEIRCPKFDGELKFMVKWKDVSGTFGQ